MFLRIWGDGKRVTKENMEDELASLNLSDDEEDLMQNQEELEVVEDELKLCLVRGVLTKSVVHFPSMWNTLAKLWHPLSGITITNISEKRSLF